MIQWYYQFYGFKKFIDKRKRLIKMLSSSINKQISLIWSTKSRNNKNQCQITFKDKCINKIFTIVGSNISKIANMIWSYVFKTIKNLKIKIYYLNPEWYGLNQLNLFFLMKVMIIYLESWRTKMIINIFILKLNKRKRIKIRDKHQDKLRNQ